MTVLRTLATLSSFAALSLLTGCGVGTSAPASPDIMTLNVSGNVHGGQQPVAGAHVYVFQSGYGSGSSYNLINTNGLASVPTQDALGFYVPTDGNGNFSITGTYQCSGSGPVYLLATQGNPGLASGTNNAALALLSVVADSCGYGSTLSPNLLINVNEMSTVAGVYALSGYLSAGNTLAYPGTSSAALPQGLTNAADTALALVNVSSGTVNATTAAGGTVPAAAITTVANIIAACVNSNGTGTGCTTLFNNATSNGVPVGTAGAGTVPTNIVTAVLNIAHNTGVIAQYPAAMTALYGLASATPPFGGGLSAQPHDFSLAVSYGSATGLVSPGVPAVDANGNVWFGDTHDGLNLFGAHSYTVSKLSPLGAQAAFTNLSQQPAQAAIDPSGNAWFAVNSGGVVNKVTAGTTTTRASYSYNGSSGDDGHQIAIDSSGNVLISDNTTGGLFELNNSGTVIGSLPFGNGSSNGAGFHEVALLNTATLLTVANGGTLVAYADPLGGQQRVCGLMSCGPEYYPSALAVDGSGDIWALNRNGTLAGFTSTGSGANGSGTLSGSPFSGGGLNTTTLSPNQPYPWLAIDGANNIWISNYAGTITEFNSTGTALSPATGLYGVTTGCKGQGAAIDGSGNLWVGCDSATAPVLEYIGIATPVTTPLLPGNFGLKP